MNYLENRRADFDPAYDLPDHLRMEYELLTTARPAAEAPIGSVEDLRNRLGQEDYSESDVIDWLKNQEEAAAEPALSPLAGEGARETMKRHLATRRRAHEQNVARQEEYREEAARQLQYATDPNTGETITVDSVTGEKIEEIIDREIDRLITSRRLL